MTSTRFVVVITALALASGCGTLPNTAFPPLVAARARPADEEAAARGPWPDRSDWWVRTRRWLERVDADIRADLDFHENEGLEGFAPDAVEQVKLMRAEMDGDGGIGR